LTSRIPGSSRRRAGSQARSSPGRFLSSADLSEFRRLRRNLRLALLALGIAVVVGLVGFAIIGQGRSGVVDVIYMTVITLTTVGFGEVVDLSGHPGARLFTSALIVGGMGVAAYTITMLTAFLVEGQLQHIFARRRMEKAIERMEDHYVVCGDTAACWYVVDELCQTNREAVVVVPDEASWEELRGRLGDTPAFVGDPTDDDVLLDARLDDACGVVFCMRNDKDNLLGVFTARRLVPDVRIVAAAETVENRAKLEAAGADAVINPGQIGGLRMASELVRPTVVTFLDQMLRVGGGSLRVEEAKVPEEVDPGSPAATIADVRFETIPGTMLMAIRRPGPEGFVFDPDLATPLEPGMALVVMTDADGRERVEERIASLIASKAGAPPA